MAQSWVREMQARCGHLATWERAMRVAREALGKRHRDLLPLSPVPADPETGELDVARIAQIIAYGTITAPLSGEQWDAVTDLHADEERTFHEILQWLPLICASCQETIEASRLVGTQHAPLTEAIDAFMRWLERFTGPAARRNALHMLEALPENGASLTLATVDGASVVDNGAMRVTSNPPKKEAAAG